MRGLFAGAAEVVGIAGDGLTEVPEPEAVDDGAGGERVVFAGDPVCEGGAAAFDGSGKLDAAEHGQGGGFHGLSGGEGIAATEDGGLFQLAIRHAVLWHADGLVDAGDLWCAAIIDAEGKGLVAFELPLQAFESFACHAFVAEVLGSEADELGRVLVLGHVLFLQYSTGGFKDAGEAAVLLHFAAVGDEGAGGDHGFVPGAVVQLLFGEPFL